jgi:hypothetical protein
MAMCLKNWLWEDEDGIGEDEAALPNKLASK